MVTAQCIREHFGDKDVIMAYGDRDIFMLMIKKEDISEESFLAFQNDVCERFPLAKISFKAGIYIIEDKTRKVRSMCDYALLAVNRVKDRFDKSYCVFEKSFLEGILLEKKITDGMQESLENGDFKVYFQPKYDIECNMMIGAEALVRWTHPQLGRMSPADFIPIFEKNGFISRLDWYMWEQVCINLSEWKKKHGKIVPVSVNVSREDFYSENFADELYALVQKYDLQPSCLHLEITETAYTENTVQIIEILKKLKEYGFIIEMDDFGSGYSSLNTLAELPVDIIKLDIKFIQNELQHKKSNTIMKFIINLAKWMNLLVIAEGVETQKQLEYLKQLNCNFVQGYFYAVPMVAEEFENRLITEDLLPIFDMKSYLKHLLAQKSSSGDAKEEILVVDDLEMNRALIIDYLKDNYKMIEAENGQIALEYIKENSENIVAVIVDIYMPVMDGFELLKIMKSSDQFKHICFIVTTSDEELMRDNRRLELADDFILKPYEKEEMVQRVKDALERQHKEELKELRRIESIAKRDRLTMLYNRDEFERQVSEILASGDVVKSTFILVDVDKMRYINDNLGHNAGDMAIKKVAEILEKHFRDEDVICRFGGAKFAVFVKSGFDKADLHNRMKKICNMLKFELEEYNIEITCSVGICCCPDDGDEFDLLFRHADMALLAAKRLGDNRYIIYGNDENITVEDKKAHPKLLQYFHKS